ncbi:MAG: ATP-dependent zinc metalloprotease FtsH [Bdellovibrionales bacterium]|nr:ATP-dependent zinc metalloprotease FtsH [Bdellovibrionales bacterium]
MRSSSQKSMALWVLIIVVTLVAYEHLKNASEGRQAFNYRTFLQAIESGQVEKDSIVFNSVSGTISGKFTEEGKKSFGSTTFKIDGDVEKAYDELKSRNVTPSYENTNDTYLTQQIFNWLPMLFLVGLFFFFIRQLQIGGGKAMAFGKSRARLLTENKNKVTFKDVAGVDEAKQELQEIVYFLKEPKKFTRLGGRIPKGVLLIGSPGTGKTLLARAVAGEANVPFFTISGSDFVEMFVGVGASRVRDLFEQGKKNAPCLIFIDEIDAVGRHRGAGMGGGHDEREQTLNQLLVEMDGFESNDGVILIAATNRPDVLDPALLRPGRFDRRVVVNKPDLRGREQILSVHTKKTPLATNVNKEKIARGTPGFSGADLENLVNEAALLAAQENKTRIEMEDFEKAKDKVLMGTERKSMVISEKDRRITAYHEAGHALVGKSLQGLDPIHKVTIIPRGMALGLTQTLPEEDSLSLTRSKVLNMIAFLFGGRAAEELIFKDVTTGAGNDIERATELARRMVCEWGMSEKLGPLALERREGPVFLGMQQSHAREYSDAKAQEIDQEVYRIVTEGRQLAIQKLQEHMSALNIMAETLLEFETIEGEEVDLIIKGSTLAEIKQWREARQAQLENDRKIAADQAEKENKARLEAEKKMTDDEDNRTVNQSGPVTA